MATLRNESGTYTIQPIRNKALEAIPGETYEQYQTRLGATNGGVGTGFGKPVPFLPKTTPAYSGETNVGTGSSSLGSTLPQPQSVDQSDPITKFNTTLIDMLKKAQGASGNEKLFEQERALQRAAIERSSQATPEELRVLSPSQQSAIRSGKVGALEPEIDAVATSIKAQDSRLRNFESILGQMRDIGGDIIKNLAPSKEILEGYKFMLRAGANPTSIPDEIRNKVMGTMTAEDWSAWKEATTSNSADTQVVEFNGQKVLINTQTGDIIKTLGSSDSSPSVQPGEDPQLYSGLTSATATAVRARVNQFKAEPTVQNFAVVQEGRNFAISIATNTKNPADDQALIYALAKALDPGSVVREGEYATAQKYAQSWINAYGKGVTQAIAGTGFLSTAARENIKKTIQQKYLATQKSYDNIYDQYAKGISTLTGRGDGEKFLTDYQIGGDSSPLQELQDDIRALSGQMTREQLIKELSNDYPEITPQQIQDAVYKMLPDDWETRGIQELSFNSGGAGTNRPQRNNNPGNLKTGGVADNLAVGTDEQGHLIFPDAATGQRALSLDLKAKISGNSQWLPANPTIEQLGSVYAEDSNWPTKVASILGVSTSTKTGQIDFNKLLQAIMTQEGFYA